jgi:predicted TIM-barrel fold metal-dependent hydrolase
MVTRREFLNTAGALGLAITGRFALADEPGTMTAPRPRSAPSFEVPPRACDTHVHIIGNAVRYPMTPNRAYTPPLASVDELQVMHKALHLERVVVVQPSFYGADNACTVDAIRMIGASARGIAVIDDKTPEADLDEMQRAGVRGVRLNLATAGVTDPVVSARMLHATVARIRSRNWHLQIFTAPAMIAALKQDLAVLPVPVVFDHFGGANGVQGVNVSGFDTMLELVASGKAYVKISAPYRVSKNPPSFPEFAPMAKALIAANADRILWGSNWPHPGTRPPGRAPSEITPWHDIDDAAILNLLPAWEPDAAVRRKILVDNPARLYGFSA